MTTTEDSVPTLPGRSSTRYVTDGGMETDLIFHRQVDLPDFAAFPLLDTTAGRDLLSEYYDGYAQIARRARAGLLLESPTWRANPDWGARLGFDAAGLRRINVEAIEMLHSLRARYASSLSPILVSGMIGPRGDGYSAASMLTPDEAADYHLPQIRAFVEAGADLATAYTLTHTGEAIGIVSAARTAGLPIAISFTVETDGRLPSGDTIADAITAVDQATPPDYYLINCAHPAHIAAGLRVSSPWTRRIVGVRLNASVRSHAELDESDELDEGDIDTLVDAYRRLARHLPALSITGGCCGTDHRHVAALWERSDPS